MWFYLISVIVLIVLWFLACLIFSEQIRKSVFAEFYTSRMISLWYESLFISLKYYQLEKFTKFKLEESTEKLVYTCDASVLKFHKIYIDYYEFYYRNRKC